MFVNESFPDGKKWEWLMEHYDAFDKPDDYNDQEQWLKEAGFNDIRIPTGDSYWSHIQAIKA